MSQACTMLKGVRRSRPFVRLRQARERELSSSARAGAWARRRARDRQYRFARRNWHVLGGVVILMGLSLIPGLMLLPRGYQEFFAGVALTSAVAICVHLVVVVSGSTHLMMGDLGEQWSSEELSGLRRAGWRLVNGVRFRPSADIDHVLIGPAGVVVVETKWGSADWASPRQSGRIADAVEQASRCARDVRLFLRPDIGSAPVRPAVVLWPSEERVTKHDVDGVVVVPGLLLRGWVLGLPTGVLDSATVDAAWRRIEAHLVRRDAEDVARDGPAPRSVTRYLLDLAQLPFGLLSGVTVAGGMLSWLGWPAYLIGAVPTGVVSAWAMRRSEVRLLALGGLVGSQAVTALTLVAAAVTLLTENG